MSDETIINDISDEQLKKLSSKDLEYLAAGRIENISSAGLEILSPSAERVGTTPTRAASIVARGIAPSLVGAAGGTALAASTFPPAIPVAAGIGSLAVPAADILTSGWNKLAPKSMQAQYPSTAIQHLLTKTGMPVPESDVERALVAGGGALSSTAGQLPALSNVAKTAESAVVKNIASNLAQYPERQLAVSAPSGATGEYVYQKTDDPYLSALASTATGAAGGIGAGARNIPRVELENQANSLFQAAKDSGIRLKTKPFQDSMKNITSSLREEGYTASAYPKVDAAIKELTKSSQPKDYTELRALRKIIQGAQASSDAEERRLASILKDKFDSYVVNIPERDISPISGDAKAGMQAWKEARDVYSRMSKADVFEDISKRAEMNATKYSQSGTENAIVADLRNLANNKNKMRLFTKDEQQEIRDAVKGGDVQNVLRFIGKYAPTSPLAAGGGAFIGSVLGGATGAGAGAIILPAVGTGARVAATKMREKQLQDLINIMRSGGRPSDVNENMMFNPIGLRGLLSNQGQ